MRLRVDHGADAVYLNLTDRPIKDSAEVATATVLLQQVASVVPLASLRAGAERALRNDSHLS